jgi:hypothetical protein
MRSSVGVLASVLLTAGVAHADQTITLDASGLTVTLPGPGRWTSTKSDAGDGKNFFDTVSYLEGNRAIVFTVGRLPRDCSVWRTMPRKDQRSRAAYWPAGMTVFEARNDTSITQKTCLTLARGPFMLLVTHGPSLDEQDTQRILAVLDAVTYAGGGAGSESGGGPVAPVDGGDRLSMPGTGLSVVVPGGAGAWTVTTQKGTASDIDFVVRKDMGKPWFQISAFQLRNGGSCVTWERRSRGDSRERYVSSPGYSPRPFAFEARAEKDGHFVGTSCLPTPRGDFVVLYEYRGGVTDHDEDALARASIQSILDSAGGARDTSNGTTNTGISGTSPPFRRPSKFLRHRVIEAGYTQISPSDSRSSGSGATLGLDSLVVGTKSLSLAGEFEARLGIDSTAGATGDARFGLGLGMRGSFAIATLLGGIGYDAVGIGQEADPMKFKAEGALYGWIQGQLLLAVTRGFAFSAAYLLASRAGDESGSENRFTLGMIFRRRAKSDIVLGLRFHNYDIGEGASSFTAALGLSY